MKYYKLILNNTIIGAVSSNNFIQYQPITGCFLLSNEEDGEYIDYKGIIYRATWMKPAIQIIPFTVVQAIEITNDEYNIITNAIDNNQPVIIDDDDDEEPQEEIPVEEPDITVEFVRDSKLLEMSRTCRQTIEAGFDLVLRGDTHHFSLTTQDQLNLMSLGTLAQTEELIPYHADGEECEFYTPQEINEIIAAAADFKNYQLAYHNALKAYINALDTIEDIAAITYGTPIPDEYKSDVLRVLE